MKVTSILCVATVLIGLPEIAWGHWPPEPYRAVEIPDDRLPVMDGDLSDWEWVPEEYVILWEDFYAGAAGADFHKSKENIDPSLIVGWNTHTNRLYFAAKVYDNKHIINHTAEHPDWINVDDCLIVMVDLVIDEVSPQYITQSGGGGSWREKSGFIVSDFDAEPQANAMNEGFADYFAASKSNSATLFEATPSFERNLATEPDSTWANTYSPPNDEHNNGMIIGQAGWDLRANIYQGQPTADKPIYNTIVAVTNSTPDDPDSGFTFQEFHDMLYIKDDDLYAQGDGLGNGTPHDDTIYEAFYTEHGITVSDSIADAIPDSTPKVTATRLPQRVSLSQNFPNPFNPTTTIRFELPRSSEVELSIYNTTGQLVRRLAEGTYERGVHRLAWDSKDERGMEVASEVYFYRLEVGKMVQTRRMVLLR